MNGKKRARIIYIACILLVLLVLAGGFFAWNRVRMLKQIAETADEAFRDARYEDALDAYGRLLERPPFGLSGIGKKYTAIGEAGAVSCVDAMLETDAGVSALSEKELIESTVRRAEHPDVSETFPKELERRALLLEAIHAEERGDLNKALSLLEQSGIESARAADLSVSLRQQMTLLDALTARDEGRLSDALALVKESGLRPELITVIEEQIVLENDRDLIERAQEALDALEHEKAIALLNEISDDETRAAAQDALAARWKDTLFALRAQYAGRIHAGAWYSLALSEQPKLCGDRRYEGIDAALRSGDTVVGGCFSLIRLTDGRVELLGDTLGAERDAAAITDAVGAALGMNHAIVLRADGTAINLGANQYGRGEIGEWTGIKKVAAGAFHNVGLTEQGTVLAAGLDADGQCAVGEWTDVIDIAAGMRHTAALHADGRVSATGDNSFGQCNVSDWQNVIAIFCGGNTTFGLTDEFRLLAAGDNFCGQCDVSDLPEVIDVAAGLWHTAAVLYDGRIVVVGADGHGQCGVSETPLFDAPHEAELTEKPHAAETEYVYIGSEKEGPWVYCSAEGCILAAFDTAYACKPTRADLICTYSRPPTGILSGGGDRPGTTVPANVLARQNHAVFALTGDYFTFGYNADGVQIRRGVVFKEKHGETGFAFFPDGSMQLVDPKDYTADDLLRIGVRDSWVFGPVLISDGEARDISYHPLSFNDVTMRTVMASLCPYHHLAMAYGNSTLAQVTENLLDYGCKIAYNLDGGRSSMMIFMDRRINRTSYASSGWRNLQDMIGFLTSDMVPRY